ncbi:DegT/DnrJ/EryC1/StrS family aminotransferase [Amycolatopsis azurea]|uniref:DegT/DnrJ/EryC1/StrS family aminotransferase n=1 Tax=Amycolatopsis azurea TaxID=36819 RepID=UPI003806B28F
MTIPFLDLRAGYLELRADIDEACARVLSSGRYLLGAELDRFEAEFADYCGAENCVAVGSGCDALELTLRALDIGRGHEVIVPSHTFIASWLAVSATGAVPVPVEPDEDTFALDPHRVEAAITPRTKAIMPVHLYGHPADLDPIVELGAAHGIPIVEDAAQAHGSRYRGERIGGGAFAAAFSFYPGKNLGALGDGGAVVTADSDLADRIRLLRNYGSRRKYQHEIKATNSRLDELQAAILRVKLPYLDAWNARRAALARHYLAELAHVPGLTLPKVAPWADHAWHLFVVRCARRSELQRALTDAGIGTLIHYPVAVHRSSAYVSSSWPLGSFPLAEQLADEVLSLPMWPQLSIADADAVIAAVRSALEA